MEDQETKWGIEKSRKDKKKKFQYQQLQAAATLEEK